MLWLACTLRVVCATSVYVQQAFSKVYRKGRKRTAVLKAPNSSQYASMPHFIVTKFMEEGAKKSIYNHLQFLESKHAW